MYEYSTKPDTDKHGFTRIIPVAVVAKIIRNDPPNSRSILGMQKNCADAEPFAERRAEVRTEHRAESDAETVQNFAQEKFILGRATWI